MTNKSYMMMNINHERRHINILPCPTLCVIIKPNLRVPRRHIGNIVLQEVEVWTVWIPWNEMNHTHAALIIHIIIQYSETIDPNRGSK